MSLTTSVQSLLGIVHHNIFGSCLYMYVDRYKGRVVLIAKEMERPLSKYAYFILINGMLTMLAEITAIRGTVRSNIGYRLSFRGK